MTATPPPGPTTQAPGRTTADLLAFLDRAFRAGLLTQPTAASYRLGANRVLSALPEHATADVTTLNADHAVAVFEDAEGQTISTATRRQYVASFRKALILFSSYIAEPERWHQAAPSEPGTGLGPGWTPAHDGGQELTIPLPRHRSMRLHLPPGVTANDTRLAKRLISSYLNEIPAARDGQG
ncbi:hypothetical protein [Catenulispora rubra]|uniref:hypothetical protein n=1 Tax=Catenulispora rubra TaxID=280293 RepID=UPI0018928845|nr:hypothetical protein [Catenulispora rubra]